MEQTMSISSGRAKATMLALASISAVMEELHPHDSFPVNKRICDAKTVDLSDAVTAFAALRSDRMSLVRDVTTAAQLSPAHAAGWS